MTSNQINYMNTLIERARLNETQRHNEVAEKLEKQRFDHEKRKTWFSIFI